MGARILEIRSIRLSEAFRICSSGFDVGVANVGTCIFNSVNEMDKLNYDWNYLIALHNQHVSNRRQPFYNSQNDYCSHG